MPWGHACRDAGVSTTSERIFDGTGAVVYCPENIPVLEVALMWPYTYNL